MQAPEFDVNGNNRRFSQNGFTLIETVITLIVLSIAAVGVLSVFTVGIMGSANPLIINQAAQLAQGEMDEVLGERAANGFDGINAACATTMPSGFSCSRTIIYVNSGSLNTSVGAPTNDKHITVSIAQPTIGGISLDTLVTNY